MRYRKIMRDVFVFMLMASLLAGCGASSANPGGGSDSKETTSTVKVSDIEAESGESLETEETVVNKQSLLKEADVDISIADAQVSDGQVGFTLYFSNIGADYRSVYGDELLVNGTPVTDLVVEDHFSDGASMTTSSVSAQLESGEESWSIITIQVEDVKSGDTVRIDYEMEFNNEEHMHALATKYLEFGITADGEILLGEDLEALDLGQSRNIEAETFPETVFYDNNSVRILGEGFTLNGENERVMQLTVENNASFEVSVRGNIAVVDGYQIPIHGQDMVVPAGETASGEFILYQEALKMAGIHSIHDMTMSWHISGEGIDYLEDPTGMVSVTTDKESAIDERDTSSFMELHNADGIVVKIDPQRYTDEWGSDHMYILWENNTENILDIEGIVEYSGGGATSGSADLYPHSKLWDEIDVAAGDVYYVRATRIEGWERIFESDHITVK